tara:strand:- start:2753 stop:3703 length:951 start_codon:yes stop_codon:yes gene_type:complete
MRIVILGYQGLIGSNILENLVTNTSFDLFCVGKNINNRPFKRKGIRYFKWDFINFNKKNLFFLNEANIIVNCVGKNYENANDLEYINYFFVKKLLKYVGAFKFNVRLIQLSSVSVYGGPINYQGQKKIISEKSVIKINDLYSKSKIRSDILIKNTIRDNTIKNLSFTILRISNVFGGKKKSNLLKFVTFSLKSGFWIKCFDDVVYNFVNINDVSQAVINTVERLKVSKNKTYIISDDCKQLKFFKLFKKIHKKKIIKITFPYFFVKILINLIPMPKKVLNFFSTISSRIAYSNKKASRELNFKPRYSILKSINKLR